MTVQVDGEVVGELQRRLHLIVHDAVDHQLVDLPDPTVADAVSVYGGFQQDAVLDRRIGAAQTRFGKPHVGGLFLLFAAGFAPLLFLAVGSALFFGMLATYGTVFGLIGVAYVGTLLLAVFCAIPRRRPCVLSEEAWVLSREEYPELYETAAKAAEAVGCDGYTIGAEPMTEGVKADA